MVAVVGIVAGTVLVVVWMARHPLPGLRDLAVTIRAFFGWPR
ncbi:MAG: hypothetical protein QOJ29_2710 [Thermoleophilaceae bacterium]|jgi:hypothetical protein|nr:hypothetical protein [Thermoleophilaceae bacterium]